VQVLVNLAMDSTKDSQGFHVGIEASKKMITNAVLASFIESEARYQIVPSLLKD